jgi:HEPN domain-containing protein
MHNEALARDYVTRARKRLAALDALMGEAAYADVVREAQEIVELALKGLLRAHRISPPRVHDVSDELRVHADRFSPTLRAELDALVGASRSLRRDRELAFYGSEDLLPTAFYTLEDAEEARRQSHHVVTVCEAALREGTA